MPAVTETQLQRWLAPARNQLGPVVAQIMAEGQGMSLAEAVSYALADGPEEAWHNGPRRTLTRRELEVAALVARASPTGASPVCFIFRSGPSTRTLTTS